jgi:hypothetical protein
MKKAFTTPVLRTEPTLMELTLGTGCPVSQQCAQ